MRASEARHEEHVTVAALGLDRTNANSEQATA